MSDFWLYVTLGFEHVLDWNGYDHTLFIVALCATHTFKTWRKMVLHVTMFTLGHSVSLALASYNVLSVDSGWIEFLIPATILVTALVSISNALKGTLVRTGVVFSLLTFFFGIIHGFGFAGYFNMINDGNILAHLLEFALGIELAQVIIALAVVVFGYIFQRTFKLKQKYWVIAVSILVMVLATPMLIENRNF
ncbi:HupE/UreJ family protein [Marinirhabdus gelatinilytica]|uniref:HupE/UreJ protein n=1 Tax=Marinirhabdus gelatinilytica TaxID=1703343 RepID=A0A370QIX6_9FLAO|nr:HupE/UreJ family protein [Marinirhabdus gelatinilytica]RDK88317.1 HupE/UreJ protein [Marinirhabdus gelatinilytica]